jgi:hypothetical protein
MISLDKYIIKSSRTASRIIDEEAIILTPEEGMLYQLNIVGTRIWELLDKTRKFTEIVSIICEEFEVEEKIAKKDILQFINELSNKEIVTLKEEE